jgi:transcriptional regulator with XRE-family HTH domain
VTNTSEHFNHGLFTAVLTDAMQPYLLREIAEQSGVSEATVSRLGKGTMPDVATLYALCAWMQVSPGVFLVGAVEERADHALFQAMYEIKRIAERF